MRITVLTVLWYSVCLILTFLVFISLMSFTNSKNNNSIFALTIERNKPAILNNSINPAIDIRIIVLKKFFSVYQSPLIDHLEEIIKQADLWGIDYALIPAIAMQESNGCKKIPSDSYNCWGLGIYGSKITRFSSYDAAIAQVAKTIKETYIKSGLTNVTLLEDKWVPPSRGQWSSSVNFFIGKIREYEKNIPAS